MNIHAPTIVLAHPERTLNMEFNAVTPLPYFEPHELDANCYGYALHIEASVNPGFRQEKRAFSETASRKSFLRAIESDGLVQVSRRSFDPTREHIIAAFLEVRSDFHFARLDGNGQWSHKPGYNWDPIQTDFFGNPFTDPETVNLPTLDFVGYFAVPEKMNPLAVGKTDKCDLLRNTRHMPDFLKALI